MSTPDPINNRSYRKTVVVAAAALLAAFAAWLGFNADGSDPTPEPTATPSVTPSETPAPVLAPSWPQAGEAPKLTFDDEFEGLTVDTNKWERGWFGEGITDGVNSNNLNCYDSAQVSQHDGMLHLTVAQRNATCRGTVHQHVSGLVNSRKSFSQQFGSFEARVCLSDADGNGQVDGFPAFWTNGPSSVSWPEHGEIDAVEGIGGRTKASLHYMTSAGGTAYGSGQYSDVTPTTAPLGNKVGCHNFGYAWTATDVTFYYDGAKLYTHAFRGPYPQYLILNYALRSTEQTIVGSEVAVDWVRVWAP